MRDCFLMIWVFLKRPVSHWFTGWVYANVIIHLSVGESPGHSPPLRWIITRYLLFSIHAWRYARFFQKQDIFHYFKAFKTEILQIHSLIRQILKQLFPEVEVTSGGYLPNHESFPSCGPTKSRLAKCQKLLIIVILYKWTISITDRQSSIVRRYFTLPTLEGLHFHTVNTLIYAQNGFEIKGYETLFKPIFLLCCNVSFSPETPRQ